MLGSLSPCVPPKACGSAEREVMHHSWVERADTALTPKSNTDLGDLSFGVLISPNRVFSRLGLLPAISVVPEHSCLLFSKLIDGQIKGCKLRFVFYLKNKSKSLCITMSQREMSLCCGLEKRGRVSPARD